MPNLFRDYITKLLSQGMGLMISGFYILYLPIKLGPQLYGDYEYMTAITLSILNVLNFGMSYGFLTRLAAIKEDLAAFIAIGVIFLVVFLSGQIVLTGLFLFTSDNIGSYSNRFELIWIAMTFSFTTIVWQLMRETSDTLGFTIISEKYYLLYRLAAIVSLYCIGAIGLHSVFLIQLIASIVFVIACFLIIRSKYLNTVGVCFVSNVRLLMRKYWMYAYPLLLTTIITGCYAFGERHMLQVFSGSEQQGIYSLALRLSSVLVVVSSALTPLLLREVVHLKNHNKENLGLKLELWLKLMSTIVLVLCIYFGVNSVEVAILGFGDTYASLGPVLGVMMFYPVTQVYGQYLQTTMLSLSLTKDIKNITLIQSFLNGVTIWILIAPQKYWGLSLGAYGLALSTVITSLIGSALRLVYLRRVIAIRPFSLFWSNLISFSVLYISASALKLVFDSNLVGLILSLVIYGIFSIIFILSFSKILIGVNIISYLRNYKNELT